MSQVNDTDGPATLYSMDIFRSIVLKLQNLADDVKAIKQTQQTILEKVIIS